MYMYIYTYVYIHIYTYTCIHTYIYTHIYTYAHIHTNICKWYEELERAYCSRKNCQTSQWARTNSPTSPRLKVSFAEYSLFHRALLQKRPTIVRSSWDMSHVTYTLTHSHSQTYTLTHSHFHFQT